MRFIKRMRVRIRGAGMKNYRTINKNGVDEIVIKKSRFIGYSMPVETEEEALAFIQGIKTKHWNATHNCHAYIIGVNKEIQRYNDDGEPSGTAGIPILEVIKKEDLTNVAVVVTRYYGGIMLGAGGLVRAYTQGAKIGLESGIIVDRIPFYSISISFDYSLIGKIQNELLNKGYIIKATEYNERVDMIILVTQTQKPHLVNLITDITSGQGIITQGDMEYLSLRDEVLV